MSVHKALRVKGPTGIQFPHKVMVYKMSKPKRKTIEVEKITREVNRLLKLDTISEEKKEAICSLLETILFQTGNYHGWGLNFPPGLEPGTEKWKKYLIENDYHARFYYVRFYYIKG